MYYTNFKVLYIINRYENKECWKSCDLQIIMRYETSITNETYIIYERNPYSQHIDEIIDEMINDESVVI